MTGSTNRHSPADLLHLGEVDGGIPAATGDFRLGQIGNLTRGFFTSILTEWIRNIFFHS